MARRMTNNLRQRLRDIMRDCIGEKNAISKEALMTALYGKQYHTLNKMTRTYLSTRTTNALGSMRRETKVFTTMTRKEHDNYYYVLKTDDEARKYADKAEGRIQRTRIMIHKAMQSVREEWHKQI